MDFEDPAVLEEQIRSLRQRLAKARQAQASTAEPVGEYRFRGPGETAISLRELFGTHHDLLVIHNMGRRCAYCTLWADGINGVARQLQRRSALVLVSPDSPAVQAAFAAERGWTLPMVSGTGSSFTLDMGFALDDGRVLPGVSAFHRETPEGPITRTGKAAFGPGDEFCLVYHMFDLLKHGVANFRPE